MLRWGQENHLSFLSTSFFSIILMTVWWRLKAERGKENAKKETKCVCKTFIKYSCMS